MSDRSQPLLSRKHAVVQFLHAVASTNTSSSQAPAFLPSLAPPRTSRPQSNLPPAPGDTKKHAGKTKADILRKYRTKIGASESAKITFCISYHHTAGRPYLPEEALIRDALYILQGISGKYVKFVDEGSEKQLVFSDDPVCFKPSKI